LRDISAAVYWLGQSDTAAKTYGLKGEPQKFDDKFIPTKQLLFFAGQCGLRIQKIQVFRPCCCTGVVEEMAPASSFVLKISLRNNWLNAHTHLFFVACCGLNCKA